MVRMRSSIVAPAPPPMWKAVSRILRSRLFHMLALRREWLCRQLRAPFTSMVVGGR